MDPIKTSRGRKAIIHLNDDLKLKQQKRHEYYIKFKTNHPNYYKKNQKKVENDVAKENVELNKKNELLNKTDNIIRILNEQLQELKNLIHN